METGRSAFISTTRMGLLNFLWIAFQNRSRDEVLALTKLTDSGEPDEANESPVSGATLPNGWYVLFLNNYDHPLITPLLAFEHCLWDARY